MKRFFITAVLVVSMILTASAQLFVGGGIGVDMSGGKFVPKTGDESEHPKTFTFQISPKIGYYVSEDLAVGVNFGFLSSTETVPKEYYGLTQTEEIKESTTGWNFGVFGRVGLMNR